QWLKIESNKTLKSLISTLKNNTITSIWFFANSMESITIVNNLIVHLDLNNIKLNTFVWDSIDYLKSSRRISKRRKKEIDFSYANILHSSHNIACISQGMKNNLINKLNYSHEDELRKLIILPFPIETYTPRTHKSV